MNVHQLREEIWFQHPVETRDAAGGLVQSWISAADDHAWANIRTLSGTEVLIGEQGQPNITHEVVCRYRTGLRAKDRILYGSRVLGIHSVFDVEERHRELRLLCFEVQVQT